MTSEQRQDFILEQIRKNGTIRIIDVSKQLHVSRETIRKDIYFLATQDLVRSIRGGATTLSLHYETDYEKRTHEHVSDKQFIAKKALGFIHDGDSVFLDYGTTTYELSTAIRNSTLTGLTIITNSLGIASNLQADIQNHVILLGGNLRHSEGSFSGPMTLNTLDNIYSSLGFFGCGGIHPEIGITNHYFDEIEVSKKAMEHCQTRLIIADHSKFKVTALYKTSNIEKADIIISDSKLDRDEIELFAQYDKKIH